MSISPIAGPLVHARAALGAEPVLWAAFASYLKYDVPGLDAEGRPKHNAAARAAATVLSAVVDGVDAPVGPGPTDVVVFGPPEGEAMRHTEVLRTTGPVGAEGGVGPYLWVLTPHRLHIARRVDRAADAGPGLLRGIASAFTPRERRPAQVKPLRPVLDVPRSRIAGFAPAVRARAHCLRMTFHDGSGFDLFFQGHGRSGTDGGPDQYERLLALSLGRTDPWV